MAIESGTGKPRGEELKGDMREAAAGVRAEMASLGRADIGDYLTFRAMITPAIIQIVFWVLVAASVLSALAAVFSGEFFRGLIALVVGPLVVRVFCELLLVTFKMNEGIQRIAKQGGLGQGGLGQGGVRATSD